jgi:hypothetical protein
MVKQKIDFSIIRGEYSLSALHNACNAQTKTAFTTPENVVVILTIHDIVNRTIKFQCDFTGSIQSASKNINGKVTDCRDEFVGKAVKASFNAKTQQGTITIAPTTRFKKIVGIKTDIGEIKTKKRVKLLLQKD